MNLFISSFKKMPGTLLGSLIIFCGIQFTISHSPTFWEACYLFAGNDNIRLEVKLKSMDPDDDRSRVFVMGSSQVREGFDESYLNKEYGGENTVFYNLGCSAGDSPIDMFMVKDRILDKNPEVIVYVLHSGAFHQDYVYEKMKYYFNPVIISYIYRYLGINEIFNNTGFFLDSFLGRLSDFYKYREGFSEMLFGFIAAVVKGQYPEKPHFFTQKSMPKSYFEEQIKKSKAVRYKSTRYTPLSQDLFDEFARDVRGRGIELIVVSGPAHPLLKKCYPRDIDRLFDDFLGKKSRDIGFKYLSEKDLPSFSGKDFVDFMHVNERGRNKISRYVGDYLIKEQLIH